MLHISNVHCREPFRHLWYVSPVAACIIVGLGVAGYPLALRALAALMRPEPVEGCTSGSHKLSPQIAGSARLYRSPVPARSVVQRL
ncbi:MAG TPA: type II 3-dehydroquinate dehydratase, partial [Propionibacteriaceae bacterium]|nr:type II 3-dehydroquinate dehydratase [Propionibacteriaceae bacterium]